MGKEVGSKLKNFSKDEIEVGMVFADENCLQIILKNEKKLNLLKLLKINKPCEYLELSI